MFSCRPNPTIKYYLNKNHGSSKNPPSRQTLNQFQKINSQRVSIYPNYIEQHRRNLIIDFKKKIQQTKSLRKRLTNQSCNNKDNSKLKMKTSREDKSYDKEDDKTLMSTEPNNKRMSFRVSTINFNITTDEKSYDTEKIYFAQCARKTQQMTAFQKNALKILKAKEQLKNRKRLISDQIDQKRLINIQKYQQIQQKSFRILTQPKR